MASVTKNLGFAITTSTSYEAPYVVAKRFSTLDHLTNGRFGWNIVTSWKASASKAVSSSISQRDAHLLKTLGWIASHRPRQTV
jgi:alkanesulfonate monooxygenase SsuD/methylene tetrahydromethanopterin reductase-like flavin-dependent oxidoreductase (luciferase family)